MKKLIPGISMVLVMNAGAMTLPVTEITPDLPKSIFIETTITSGDTVISSSSKVHDGGTLAVRVTNPHEYVAEQAYVGDRQVSETKKVIDLGDDISVTPKVQKDGKIMVKVGVNRNRKSSFAEPVFSESYSNTVIQKQMELKSGVPGTFESLLKSTDDEAGLTVTVKATAL